MSAGRAERDGDLDQIGPEQHQPRPAGRAAGVVGPVERRIGLGIADVQHPGLNREASGDQKGRQDKTKLHGGNFREKRAVSEGLPTPPDG
jgi:hypothetical protein